MASSEIGQIQDFLLVFKRRIWQVVIPALFVLALGVLFAVIVPKKYVVDTRIELFQAARGVDENPEEAATLREIINAEYHVKNLYRVQETIVSQNWTEYARLDEKERKSFVESVADDLSVDVLTPEVKDQVSSVFVDIEYADTDGRRAERFLSALTDRWIDDVVKRDYNQLLLERDEYQNQVDAAQEAFDETTAQKLDLQSEMGVSITQPADMRSQRDEDPVYVELGIARQERDSVAASLGEVRAKIEKVRAEYEVMERDVPVEEIEPGVEFREQILALETQIAEFRKLQEGKTSENSLYKKGQREIEALEEQIQTAEALQRESTRRTVFQPNEERIKLGEQLAALELDERGLTAKLEAWNREVEEKSSAHQAQIQNWSTLTRITKAWDHASIELDEAKSRLRAAEARIAAHSSERGDPYRIVQAPQAPDKPSEPNPIIIVVAGLLGGIALGLAVAFISEYSKSCYRSVGDLSRGMGVPILGAINVIRTRMDVRRQRTKRLLIGGSTLAILGCVGWFTYAWVYDQGRLPTGLVQAVEDLRLALR
jgi:uncharacterized protein involved in exopolysaccharide biosynthesis